VTSSFQLIAGTNRDLAAEVAQGRFREDLLARINLWTFCLPGLAQRREDIEPNIRYELEQFASRHGRSVTFNKEAREKFLAFALSPRAAWKANFRDLNAAMTRMATLATSGRIGTDVVEEEIGRLEQAWDSSRCEPADELLQSLLGADRVANIDPFERVQLAEVLRVCRRCRSLAEAGRQLFCVSRLQKAVPNDADRLRKYLARYGLAWADLQ
jgi:transcriptional regulatory protein RtcR